MPDIGINFHATPHEIADWIREWATAEGVFITATFSEPFAVESVEIDDISRVIENGRVWRISFLVSPPNLKARYQSDFDHEHSTQLTLVLGRLLPDGLGESWLSCRTDDLHAFQKWKKLASDLRARTSSGVTAFNQVNGVSHFYASHRYSSGAKVLEAKGINMLPMQGPNGPMLRLGNVSEFVE